MLQLLQVRSHNLGGRIHIMSMITEGTELRDKSTDFIF